MVRKSVTAAEGNLPAWSVTTWESGPAAAPKQEAKQKPSYVVTYSRSIRLIRAAAVLLLAAAAVVSWVLAWKDFLEPVVQVVKAIDPATAWGRVLIDVLARQPLRPLVSAHISLLLTAGAIAFIYALLPDLALDDEGLMVRTPGGWRVVPWAKMRVVRIMSFEEEDRHLVLVQGAWTRFSPWPRLVSMLFGAGVAPGVLITSAIRDFEPLMVRLYREVTQAVPEAVFDDEFVSPTISMVVAPVSTLAGLVDRSRDEGWPADLSAQVMAAVAAGLALVQLLLMALLLGGSWFRPVAIVILCGVEWLIGALYLYAVAEVLPGSVEFRQAALLYPLPQIPRAILAVPMAMLISAGLTFLAVVIGLAAVLWAVILTVLLVQKMYRLDSVLPAAIGGVLQAVFQFIVLAIAFT
jgi:hypothetical protein